MNKMVKLPLFLGICGGVCAGILAGVYALTDPIITANTEKAANQAIYEAFKDYGDEDSLTVTDLTKELSSDLKNVGVTGKKSVTEKATGNIIGMVYTCTTTQKGYAGTISFQVAIANGKFISYTDLGNSETKSLISQMDSKIKGADVSGYEFALVSGQTYTSSAIKSALDKIAEDYVK